MSIKAMNWVWECSRTIGNDRLVLLAIADRASDEGMDAWPSVRTLAGKTRLHERTVQRCIRNIEALAELEIRRTDGPHGTNVYIVRMDALVLRDSRERRRVPVKRSPLGAGGITPGNSPPGDNLTPGGGSAGGGVAPPPPGGGDVATGGVAPPPPDSSCTSSTTSTSIRTAAAPRLVLTRDPNPNGNYRVIAKLAFDLLALGAWESAGQRFAITTESELIQALKDECGRLHIDYGAHPDTPVDVLHRVAASEWFKHTHPDIAGRRQVATA